MKGSTKKQKTKEQKKSLRANAAQAKKLQKKDDKSAIKILKELRKEDWFWQRLTNDQRSRIRSLIGES